MTDRETNFHRSEKLLHAHRKQNIPGGSQQPVGTHRNTSGAGHQKADARREISFSRRTNVRKDSTRPQTPINVHVQAWRRIKCRKTKGAPRTEDANVREESNLAGPLRRPTCRPRACRQGYANCPYGVALPSTQQERIECLILTLRTVEGKRPRDISRENCFR